MPAISAISPLRRGGVVLPVLLAAMLASCGGGAGASTLRAATHTLGRARASSLLPLLEGDGIGSVKFGQSPDAVAARLRRLFGPPDGSNKTRNGYRRDVCGFYVEQWGGLGAASNGHLFYAGLQASFRNSQFVGYNYYDNNMETYYGLGSTAVKKLARRRVMLSTAKGLAVGDPLARGQRLYGRNFVVTAQMQGRPPKLGPVAAWKASTASGRIEGTTDSPILIEGPLTSHPSSMDSRHRRSIEEIDAGTNPRTPCANRYPK